jgi:hypothetical protein
MVGASFTVAAVAQVLRSKKGITAVGNAQVDTAQSKFGGASLLLDGTGDYLLIDSTNTADLNFGTGDFTIEFWARNTNRDAFHTVIANNKSSWTAGSVTILGGSGSTSTTALRLAANSFNSGGAGLVYDNQAMTVGVWYHYAIVRSGNNFTMYRDGTSVSTGTFSGSINLGEDGTRVGYTRWDGDVSTWDGHLDEIRISSTARYTATFTPSTTPFVNDANTLLLIHANGTDGSTFFEDDNGVRAQRAIQAVGNAQISTAQSKFGGSSMLFDGSGDSFVVDHSGQMRFGTGDFTMEFWYRPISKFQNYPVILGNRNGFSSGAIIFQDRHDANNTKLSVYIYNLSTSVPQFISTTTTANNTWYHIALSRSGTSLRLFVNGTQEGATVTTSADIDTGAGNDSYYIGFPGGSADYNGYTDEVRVSNTARYTANFTAPTQPFVNDANTLLLVHADGTNASTVVRDDNGALANRQPKYITAVGNAQVDTAQSKFGGASAQFDGTGDALNISADSTFNFGTSDYTVECWIRSSSLAATRIIADLGQYTQNSRPVFYVSTDGKINIYTAATGAVSSAGSTITTNTWYHVALVRSSGTTTIYVDGVSKASTATSYNMSTTAYLNVGAENVTTNSWNGWIDEFRVSNTARYTTTFTPSTTPFVNDANTLLLIHANGTDASTVFTDDTANRTQIGIIANGNAQISTAQSKFGGASALFDGNADYLETNSNLPALSFGTGDFTFEGWFRFANTNADMALYTGSTSNGDLDIRRVDDNTVRIGRVNTAWDLISGASGITSNTWHHIAIVRQSTTLTIYVDGASKGSTSNSINYTVASQIRIGSFGSGGGLSYNGYMDEMRVSNIARYTAAFTPSTTPFQNDANTLLLLHMDGTNASTVFFDDNGIAPYTP